MEFPFFKTKNQTEVLKEETISLNDIIAPSSIEVKQNYLKVGEKFVKNYSIFSYPRQLHVGWLSPVINMNMQMDVSFHFHPVNSEKILRTLRRKVTDVQAQIMEREEKGMVRDPSLEFAYRDLEDLRDKIQTAQERMFHFSLYISVYGNSEEELISAETELRAIFEPRLTYLKPALYQQKEAFTSSSPYNLDLMMMTTLMNTGPISSVFPFVSFDLSSNEGILYGINKHNNSLVLFDRFTLPNANACIFATSGAGKSYMVKLEILRYLMFGVDCIIIDPENEYKSLSEAVGGSFFNVSLSSNHRINPFDIPLPGEGETPEDVLRGNIINLVGLIRIMLGGLTPEEDGIVDKALSETYAIKDITPDSDSSLWGKENGLPFPTMSDFEEILGSMEGGESLLKRIQKFTRGTYANFFNQQSNVDIKNRLVVFGIRDMEDELKPIALYIVLRYIWKTITSSLKKRLLIIDEAWWLMKDDNGASFLFGTVKRARKYYLGVTTITQDINDFMSSEYGKPIITNSSLIFLLRQSSATIQAAQKTFNFTDEEKYLLLESSVGEGIFFAGTKHILMRVIASYTEDQIITTSPEELIKIKEAKKKFEEE
ncbi:MAG: DUF87 domain-containing protein [Candidatus Paceibacterota bacterium]